MTISYSGNLARLLVRWRGSIWKGVWKELLVWLILYFLIRLIYQFWLDDKSRTDFEYLAQMFDSYVSDMELTFLLGFYVNVIVTRWWQQFQWVAWPDDLLSLLGLLIKNGQTEKARLKRHTVARYLNLTAALAWRDVSTRVRKRFPTINHLVSSGLMNAEELQLYESAKVSFIELFGSNRQLILDSNTVFFLVALHL